jgi:HEAT repeat protein
MGLFDWLFKSSLPNVAKLKQARDVVGLIQALKYHGENSEPHEELSTVVGPAVDALGELRDPQARAPLQAMLKELDNLLEVQAKIMKSTHVLSGDRRQRMMIRDVALKKAVAAVRSKVENALKSIGPETASTRSESSSTETRKVSPDSSLSKDIPTLIRDLQHGNADSALQAAHQLGSLGTPAAEALVDAVGDEGMRERLRFLKDRREWRDSDAGLLILELARRILSSRGFGR